MREPEDELIYQFDLEGKPTIQLPLESMALQAANKIFARLLAEVMDDQAGIASQPAGE
jgi:hypothetical protein